MMAEQESSDIDCWRKTVIKQGYLIKFHRGLLKAPKMQYFVLTPNGLIAFNSKPDNDSKPFAVLPFEELSSIKVDEIELNSCKLSCMHITSKTTTTSFLLAFSRKDERDEWMMATMTAFSEALITTRGLKCPEAMEATPRKTTPSISEGVITAATHLQNMMTSFSRQSTRRKLRKRNHGDSLRRSKSYDALTFNDCTNRVELTAKSSLNIPQLDDATVSYQPSRKRKSEPDIHVITHFPSAWALDSQSKEFHNNCQFEHRDSLTLSSKKCGNKCDTKTNIISKLFSKYSTKHVQLKD